MQGDSEQHGVTVVTGATGFLGRHLVAHLCSRGLRVRAAALPEEDAGALEAMGMEVVRADLTRPETLPALFAGTVDRVFHLGGICNFSTPYHRLRPVNVDGVEHITRVALAFGVRAFVHMSSTSVYGACRGTPLREDDPRIPQDDYGRSKSDGEDVVWQRLREGLPAIVLRPCTVYGPGCGDGAGKVFSRPTRIGAIPGKGAARLSNVRVEDVVGAAWHLATRADAVGHAFNVADATHPTVGEALRIAAATFGTAAPRARVPIAALAVIARFDAVVAGLRRRIPDLEPDAVRYLARDYLVSNAKLVATGFELRFPDFTASMHELGERWRASLATTQEPLGHAYAPLGRRAAPTSAAERPAHACTDDARNARSG